jgi:hypothetical protein
MRSAARSLLLTACSSLLLGGAARAQQEVGVVSRIAEKKGKFVDQTSRAELWRTGGELHMQVKRSAPVLLRDIVRLRERIFINLSFDQPAFKTEVYLGSTETSVLGSYEILQDSVGAVSGLELVVKQGVMVVDHARGELLVLANGIRTKIFGTTALFVVDSISGEGTAYLSEGHLSFPDYGMDATGTNRVWRLRPGQPPVEVFAPAADPERWQRQVKYTTQSVWHATPFWQTPGFLLPAAAVVAGGVGCMATSCLGGGGGGGVGPGSRGGVVVTIPP